MHVAFSQRYRDPGAGATPLAMTLNNAASNGAGAACTDAAARCGVLPSPSSRSVMVADLAVGKPSKSQHHSASARLGAGRLQLVCQD